MIVVDSSALLAILEHEPDRHLMIQAIAGADRRLLSAVNYQETAQVVFSRRGAGGVTDLDELITLAGVEIIPHTAELARAALAAFQRFGKGISPVARLNFCDCAAYALARALGVPLLFKGQDFVQTDVRAAR